MKLAALGFATILSAFTVSVTAQKPQYPDTRRVDQVDTYFGVKVADPYRWLEDENSPETARWVEAENHMTFAYLEGG